MEYTLIKINLKKIINIVFQDNFIKGVFDKKKFYTISPFKIILLKAFFNKNRILYNIAF